MDINLWQTLSDDLNFIGGGKMEKPRVAGIDYVIRKEVKFDEAWLKAKDEIDGMIKEYKFGMDQKLRNAQVKIIELENQNVILAKEIIKHRKREAQIAEMMGWQRPEKR